MAGQVAQNSILFSMLFLSKTFKCFAMFFGVIAMFCHFFEIVSEFFAMFSESFGSLS